MVSLLAATFILCAGAISRTLGHPLAAISEIALCLFAWSVFLGADCAYRAHKMVYVEIIIDQVKPSVRRVLYAIIYIIITLFLVLFICQSINIVGHSWVRKWSSLPTVSYGWVALCMPAGCTLLLISTFIHFYQVVIKGNLPVREEFDFSDVEIEEN